MRARSPFAASSVVLATLTVLAACGGSDRADVTPTSGNVTSASASQSSGGGGDGDGGAGGAATAQGGGGSTGDGGGTASTTSGAGGQPSWDTCETPAECLGDEPSICPENACEDEDLFFVCDGTDEPPRAYFACVVSADHLRENVWGRLVDCFREATPDALCDDGTAIVDACLTEAADSSCDNEGAVETCAAAAELCDDPGSFPTATCEADLRLYGPTGLEAYLACIPQVVDVPCEEQHATCASVLLAY